MKDPFQFLAVGICAVLGLGACSDDETNSGDGTGGSAGSSGDASSMAGSGGDSGSGGSAASGTGGSSGSGGSGPEAATDVTVSGVVVDGSTGTGFDVSGYEVAPDVQVCVYEDDTIPCVTTSAEGAYELAGVPRGMQVYLSYEKDGYSPILYAVNAAADFVAPHIILPTVEQSTQFLTDVGETLDPALGTIFFGAITPGTPADSMFYQEFGGAGFVYIEGYTVTVTPAPSAGPFYTDVDWTGSSTLTSSSAAGWGIIIAAPGTYTLTFTHPDYACPPGVQTRVVAGYGTTYVGTACQPSVTDAGADAN